MQFTKEFRYNEPFWFSGIYKISGYSFFNGEKCPPYYHAYLIKPGRMNWGDYVGGRVAQYDKRLTFNQAIKLCKEHAKDYAPTSNQLKQAGIARKSWIEVQP